MTRAVVVGGGIAGLAAALALLDGGAEVTVVEAASEVGGKLRVSDVAGIPVDEGAEMVLRRSPEALELIERLGIGDRVVVPETTAARVWARGTLRPMPAGTVMGVPSRPGSLRGVLSAAEVARAALDRVLPGSAPGDDVALGRWVGRRLGRAVVDRLVDPLLGGVYAGRADELSAAATVPSLPLDERSALAAARRALGESSGSSEGVRGAPPREPVFATLRDGLGSLPAAAANEIRARGGTIETSCIARRLEPTADGWRAVVGPTAAERALTADAVVLALPPAPASRLLHEVARPAAAELAGVETASMAIVTTAWRSDDARPPAGSGYLVPAASGRPVKAVTISSQKWAHLATPGTVIVRCSIGRHGEVSDVQRDDADLVEAAVQELTVYAGFRGHPVDTRVSRWGGALPQYAVGHLARVARVRAAVSAQPGLAVCGSTYEGVGVPACIRTGRAAAAAVLAAPALRSP